MCTLFVWLVRQLPATTTIVCMIDSIQLYEQDQYEDDIGVVLGCLLSLADNEDPSANNTSAKAFSDRYFIVKYGVYYV
ncbi:hypothetical protein BTUL_0196g00140 [Botrytis tulipae]|uniref:Uncharacterized protein n=1 Tax=Botrytis tulipae TaxID=87230 RepID=A0A4Z1EBS1_9HELO|nr:hypothetical protein BTUL_0196g00140 [Botrytis tulipae]